MNNVVLSNEKTKITELIKIPFASRIVEIEKHDDPVLQLRDF